MKTITATELARNTSGILDQVVDHGETIVVERNRTVIARMTPEVASMNALDALAGIGAVSARRRTSAGPTEICFGDGSS